MGVVSALVAAVLTAGTLAAPAAPDYSTAEAGNPFVDGWYADAAKVPSRASLIVSRTGTSSGTSRALGAARSTVCGRVEVGTDTMTSGLFRVNGLRSQPAPGGDGRRSFRDRQVSAESTGQ